MSEAQGPAAPERVADDRLLDHLASAAELVTARRFREAEVEVLRALSITPTELRGLKLLALVRFKLGRLDEARALCREIVAVAPRDAGARLKLGLIALKLDRLEESVQELETAARLAPSDLRAWNYLGFAYARRGERARAAAAFRRAGAEAMAAELEAEAEERHPEATSATRHAEGDEDGPRAAGPGSGRAIISPGALPSTAFEPAFDLSLPIPARAAPVDEPETRDDIAGVRPLPVAPAPRDDGSAPELSPAPLVGFAAAQLVPPLTPADGARMGRPESWRDGPGTLSGLPLGRSSSMGAAAHLAIGDGAFVRADAAVACAGRVRWEEARRRVRGRADGERLGVEAPFFRVQGRGELFVAAPAGRLLPLLLEDDVLYVREDAVVAFEGTVSWEYGRVPRAPLAMLQFRGRGLVTICVRGETGAIKVSPERPVQAAERNLLGWVGRVVASGDGGGAPASGGPTDDGGPLSITCEGEGVVLFDVVREREGGRSA